MSMKHLIHAALLCLSSTIQASPWIAYNQLEDPETQNYEIYVMDKDGKTRRNISNHPGVDWVYYSVNGKLYFLSDRDECSRCFHLYEMEADGSSVRKISQQKMADSWFSSRRNGTQFVVKFAEPGWSGFAIIDLKGNLIEKVRIDLPYSSDPAFSPDGQSIVFRGAAKASPQELGFIDELYVLNLKAEKPPRSPTKITSNPDARPDKPWRGYFAAAPRWYVSHSISFAAKRDNNYDIYSVSPDGQLIQSLTPKQNNQVFHDWSETGELIFEASMNNHTGYELYIRRTDGKVEQLTDDDKEQYAPVFVEVAGLER